MESLTIDAGNRIVQENHGAHLINIPNIATRVLGITAGDVMKWRIVNGELRIERIREASDDL